MSKTDYYELLGVDKSASQDELKRCYRKKAMQYHPDRNPGDKEAEAKFKEVNEAYEILKDEEKRAAYDRFGHAAFEQGGGGAGAGGFGGFGGFGGGSFADIFEEMFGGGFAETGRSGGRAAQHRGSDLRYNMEITLEEAYLGVNRTITVPTSTQCDDCHGSGAEKGTTPETCTMCHGMGKVRAQQGFFTVERTCPTCSGTGKIIKNPCKSCHGSGRVNQEQTLSVSIPAGVESNTRIRLAGKGEAGMRGGPAGDLYIFIDIQHHKLFERDGADLHIRVPIPMTKAALGGSIEVPTLEGSTARISIPAGTQTGRQFRLRDKGMSVLRSPHRGNLYVHAVIETPMNLTAEQKELLEKFEATYNDQDDGATHPESHGFFGKVKEFWDDLKQAD